MATASMLDGLFFPEKHLCPSTLAGVVFNVCGSHSNKTPKSVLKALMARFHTDKKKNHNGEFAWLHAARSRIEDNQDTLLYVKANQLSIFGSTMETVCPHEECKAHWRGQFVTTMTVCCKFNDGLQQFREWLQKDHRLSILANRVINFDPPTESQDAVALDVVSGTYLFNTGRDAVKDKVEALFGRGLDRSVLDYNRAVCVSLETGKGKGAPDILQKEVMERLWVTKVANGWPHQRDNETLLEAMQVHFFRVFRVKCNSILLFTTCGVAKGTQTAPAQTQKPAETPHVGTKTVETPNVETKTVGTMTDDAKKEPPPPPPADVSKTKADDEKTMIDDAQRQEEAAAAPMHTGETTEEEQHAYSKTLRKAEKMSDKLGAYGETEKLRIARQLLLILKSMGKRKQMRDKGKAARERARERSFVRLMEEKKNKKKKKKCKRKTPPQPPPLTASSGTATANRTTAKRNKRSRGAPPANTKFLFEYLMEYLESSQEEGKATVSVTKKHIVTVLCKEVSDDPNSMAAIVCGDIASNNSGKNLRTILSSRYSHLKDVMCYKGTVFVQDAATAEAGQISLSKEGKETVYTLHC